MATVNEKMTALANEIRELSGTTDMKSLDEMKVDVDAANTEIAEQADLIEQIATALEGKAGGGSNIEPIWGWVYTNLVVVTHGTAFLDGKVVSDSWDIDGSNIVKGQPGGLLMGYTKNSTIFSDPVYLLSLEDCSFSGCEFIATGTNWFIVKILEQDFVIDLTWEQV